MLIVILLIIISVLLISGVLFYYNYIARFQRVNLYGKKEKRLPLMELPNLNIAKSFINENEHRLYQLLIQRHLPLVACLGDSITHGIISTNYVEKLQKDYNGKFIFINSGINGNLAYNLRIRLERDCLDFKPDYITILIGTNDVNSQKDRRTMKKYIKQQKLPQKPDMDFYRENLLEIIKSLKKNTNAEIAIMSIPLIGEELDSRLNVLAVEYNKIIKSAAKDFKLEYLPLNEMQREYLGNIENRNPSVYSKKNILKIFYLMLKKSFDEIAENNGNHLTYDGLHATSKGAEIIKDLVSSFLDKKIPANKKKWGIFKKLNK
jgi:acyl-CoA thioesterase I